MHKATVVSTWCMHSSPAPTCTSTIQKWQQQPASTLGAHAHTYGSCSHPVLSQHRRLHQTGSPGSYAVFGTLSIATAVRVQPGLLPPIHQRSVHSCVLGHKNHTSATPLIHHQNSCMTRPDCTGLYHAPSHEPTKFRMRYHETAPTALKGKKV